MSELYDQIIREHGKTRNFLDRIPGLRGYLDKGDRRKADRMLREHIAQQLEQRKSRFVSLEKQILQAGGMAMMSKTRDAKTKFQSYIDRVEAAAPGYSGFFAAVNVDELALEELYAFDAAQVSYVDRFDAELDALEKAINDDEGLESAIQSLYNLAEEAMRAFELREDVLTKLNQTYS